MKKSYLKPNATVVALTAEDGLLAGSNLGSLGNAGNASDHEGVPPEMDTQKNKWSEDDAEGFWD
jgi:hypothetical protein